MKKFNNKGRAAAFLGVVLTGALAGCGGGSGGDKYSALNISGTLSGNQSRALRAASPVVGALVSACGGSDITDNNGAFSFDVDPAGCAGGDVLFTFSGAVSGSAVVPISSTSDSVEISFNSGSSPSDGVVEVDSLNEIDDDSADDGSHDSGDDSSDNHGGDSGGGYDGSNDHGDSGDHNSSGGDSSDGEDDSGSDS